MATSAFIATRFGRSVCWFNEPSFRIIAASPNGTITMMKSRNKAMFRKNTITTSGSAASNSTW